MSLKTYYVLLTITHSLLVGLSAVNLYNVDYVEQTFANVFLLYSMLGVSAVYFIGDLIYMIVSYKKPYKQFIIHHILYLVMLTLDAFNTSFRFMRYVFSTTLISEASSIFLDLEALYKIYKNPNADPMEMTKSTTKVNVLLKALFFTTFLSMRYVYIPYLIYSIMIDDWQSHEYIIFAINVPAYAVMHIFWFYKLVLYFGRKCKKQA